MFLFLFFCISFLCNSTKCFVAYNHFTVCPRSLVRFYTASCYIEVDNNFKTILLSMIKNVKLKPFINILNLQNSLEIDIEKNLVYLDLITLRLVFLLEVIQSLDWNHVWSAKISILSTFLFNPNIILVFKVRFHYWLLITFLKIHCI